MRKIKSILLLMAMVSSQALGSTTFTTNYNLSKPSDGSTQWGSLIRGDLDSIDSQMFVNAGSISTHISNPTAAHAATAISTSVGTFCSTAMTVQAYLACLDTEVNSLVAGGGSVTTVSVVGANGLAGTVSNPTTTPAITLSTTVNGIVKGNGTALSAATSGTDYAPGTSGNATGIVKTTTGTGALTTAVAGDFPTLNQNTTGSAALNLLLAGGTMSGNIAMGGFAITGVLDPANPQDVASKIYVDNVAANGVAKGASVYATTAALPAVVYNNGSSGVGATLTGVAVGALSVDGNSPTVGQRILIKNQVSTFQNGIYTVTATGSGAAVFVLTRATDFNSTTDIVDGATTFITSGTAYPGNVSTTWELNIAGAVTVGTTALTFSQIAGPGTVTGGTGITVTGSSVAITNTAVTPASYTNANITVNAQGQITSASNGTSGSGQLSAKFTLNDATVPYTNIDGPHYQVSTQSLTVVNITALNSGTSGSTQIRVNQYRSGSLFNSATATISASSGNPVGSASALSGTLSLLAGDVITVDVVSVAGGSPEGLTVEY